MKYNGYEIKKQADGRFKIYDVFGEDKTNHDYKSSKEAKGVVDNVLTPSNLSKRYMAVHYSQYWWAIIDKTTNLYVKGDSGVYKLLLFKNREDAFNWCKDNNI